LAAHLGDKVSAEVLLSGADKMLTMIYRYALKWLTKEVARSSPINRKNR
jgi:hypothetical protein